jgi:integrase
MAIRAIRPKEDCRASHSAAGLCRSASLVGDHVWFSPGPATAKQGIAHPPDSPSVKEIIAVMRVAGDRPDGLRLRGVTVVLWRAGLRISEALTLAESGLDRTRGAVLVRRGKGRQRREVGMDRWGPGAA